MKNLPVYPLLLIALLLLPAVMAVAIPRDVVPPMRGKDWPLLHDIRENRTPFPETAAGFEQPGRGIDIAAWEARRPAPLSNWPAADPNPPIDVLHYDLDLEFAPLTGGVAGTATLTVLWGSDPDNVMNLNLVGMTVEEVRDGAGLHLNFSQSVDTLDIAITPPPVPGDTVTVAIDYEGTPDDGFYIYPSSSFTFTEPEDSRYWFPCHDVPWDKATLTLHGQVPVGNQLVSNGILDSTTVEGNYVTYHWREDHPLATYLIAAAMGDYTVVVPPKQSVTPLAWYTFPAHAAQAETAFQYVDSMLVLFSDLLIPYPFDKFFIVECEPEFGVEHQTCTLLGSFAFTGGMGHETITAHELVHHWFGDLVTMEDWQHVWLNEGFATFYQAVWEEEFYGPAAFDAQMRYAETQVFGWIGGWEDHPVLDPPSYHLFSPLGYYKGAWVLRMLRDIMGKPAFDAAVREYLTTYAYGNATTADLRWIMGKHYGGPLGWYFDQWLMGLGYPNLRYVPVFSQFGGEWLAQITIQQMQSPTIFRFPLEMRITTTAGDTLVSAWVEDDLEVLTFQLPDQPLAVSLDPLKKILDRHYLGEKTGVAEVPPPPARLRAWPNPFQDRVRIQGTGAAGTVREVEVFDVQGRRVRTLRGSGLSGLAWDGRDDAGRSLPAGAYFVRRTEGGEATRVVRLP